MKPLKFSECPFIIRLMTCVSMFMVWVLFAEFIIDRYGWHAHIPFYRLGDVCPYELGVIGLIIAFWRRAHRRDA